MKKCGYLQNLLKQSNEVHVLCYLPPLLTVLAPQQVAGHRGGRPAADGEGQAHPAPLGLQQRVLERPAGEGLCQVSDATPGRTQTGADDS